MGSRLSLPTVLMAIFRRDVRTYKWMHAYHRMDSPRLLNVQFTADISIDSEPPQRFKRAIFFFRYFLQTHARAIARLRATYAGSYEYIPARDRE